MNFSYSKILEYEGSIYNYKRALEAIVSNFSHSSMITPHPLLRVIISVLVLSNESVSDLSLGGENPCLTISNVDALLATVDSIDSTEYHFIINLKRSTNQWYYVC